MKFTYKNYAVVVYRPHGTNNWYVEINGQHNHGYKTAKAAKADAMHCIDHITTSTT